MVTCLNRKKSSLSSIQQIQARRIDKITIPQINRQITPKLITLEHKKEEVSKQNSKKVEQVEDKNNIEMLSDHWKSRQKRNKLNRKLPSRYMKSIEAREVR